MASLGVAAGGYNETAWGWAALAFSWVAALALILRDEIRLARLEIVFVGALLGFGLLAVASTGWGATATEGVREGQRTLVYVAGAFAILVATRSRSYESLIGGTWAACTLVSTLALGTRLFAPEPGSTELEGYRLSALLGYWNALGIFAAIGAVLALGLAAQARGRLLPALAAASTVPLLATVYFTFGRGPWIALAVGVAAALALDPQRLQLALVTLVLAAPAAVALWLAFHSEALTRAGSSVAAAERDGQRLAFWLAVLAGIAAVAVLVVRALETRVAVGRSLRLAFGAAIVVALCVAMGATVARHGSPPVLVDKVVDGLNAPPVQTDGDLSRRFLSLSSSGRIEHWRVAWDVFEEHPLLGSGAGTYERHWLQDRREGGVVRDAHNLYVETLAELGVVGLALLLVVLGTPLVAAVRGRRDAFVPAALGGYVAFLAHSGIDWDWEMPAVTLAALFCASALLVAARRRSRPRELRPAVRAGLLAATLVLAFAALTGVAGSQAIESSEDAEKGGEFARAESEARAAIRWAPWSAAGWDRLAQVRFAQDDLPGAREALLEAVAKSPGDWALWFDLGVASEGEEQLRAYREAARLNPRSGNVGVLRILGVLPPLDRDRS